MRKVVEKTGPTYEEAVALALAELGIPRERAEVVLLRARDTDRGRPGPEEYMVRVWEKSAAEMRAVAAAAESADVPPAAPLVCEKTAPTFEEAVRTCLESLGITEEEADIQVLRREDTNPLRPGPERITVRVWRRHLTEPAPKPGAAGAEDIHDVHAAAHLPSEDDLSFEGSTETDAQPANDRQPGSMEETR